MLTETKDGVILQLTIVPRASRNEVVGRYGDTLKIRLQAPPVDGKANHTLLRFLASTLHVPRKSLELLSGQSNRKKRVLVHGISVEHVKEHLRQDPDG